ncbi:aspartyl/asparaginyl beta-hydroxylase-like isoform X1 [Oncorhynchus keta]|uniref:aspartyl/asparaginyl beta-hydroxylase-like isoform X1 n=1 Tax=Oncorhynchus keta TaxID=8018 RepID=UPI00227C9C2E|nr:aspartyl/asparaginyl beta-hydroxylase-like isoform X1 [Oncorhynchus keta]
MEEPIVEPTRVLEPVVVVEQTEEGKAQLASKNGKKPEGAGGSSFFTWFMVLALLGVWTSVAVVYFDLVDYQGTIAKAKDMHSTLSETLQGKLSSYDADGDGDFDVEDAKVLLGLTKDGSQESSDSLEEVLDMLAEEGSDWFQGFFTFLYGLINPFEPFEDEEGTAEEEEESAGTSQTDEVLRKGCVILGLHNQ